MFQMTSAVLLQVCWFRCRRGIDEVLRRYAHDLRISLRAVQIFESCRSRADVQVCPGQTIRVARGVRSVEDVAALLCCSGRVPHGIVSVIAYAW